MSGTINDALRFGNTTPDTGAGLLAAHANNTWQGTATLDRPAIQARGLIV
jgi:hypothetical protein